MRTLSTIRQNIEVRQAEYRRLSRLNAGAIRGARGTELLQDAIAADMAEYNLRSRRDHYEAGRFVPGPAAGGAAGRAVSSDMLREVQARRGLTNRQVAAILNQTERSVELYRQGKRTIRGPAAVLLRQLAEQPDP